VRAFRVGSRNETRGRTARLAALTVIAIFATVGLVEFGRASASAATAGSDGYQQGWIAIS